jgi:hypothetical protein
MNVEQFEIFLRDQLTAAPAMTGKGKLFVATFTEPSTPAAGTGCG